MTNEEVVADFSRRWNNTFVWMYMEQVDRDVLVKITGVESHPRKIATINIQTEEFGNMMVNFGSDTGIFKFKYPPVGVFQYQQDAVVFHRRPQRQWRRGICTDNSTLYFTHRWMSGKQIGWGLAELQAAYDHKTFDFDSAITALSNKTLRSAALNNGFSLCLSLTTNTDNLILLHWLDPVALVDQTTGQITKVLNSHYRSLVGNLHDNFK